MAILRFLLIFFLVIILISYIVRILARIFFKRIQRDFNQQQGYKNRPEGDVTVSSPPKQSKIVDKNVGDYVDYEEVE